MDEPTIRYYSTHACEIAQEYDNAASSIEAYFPTAFTSGMRVLDIGGGSGRDMNRLLEMGCNVYGVEPCGPLRDLALERYPGLTGRLISGGLPNLGLPFGGEFDGVLCSAVLMHVPIDHVFDVAYAIRSVLRDGGRLLLSIPSSRPGLDLDFRDANGRLFTPLKADYLELLFERLGFQLVGKWSSEDGLNRQEHRWHTLLFQLLHADMPRPVDLIEGVLNRDRKTATYKLALFRALSEIATTEFHQARWIDDGLVAVPVDSISQKWLYYYWPFFESTKFIPQIRGEAETCLMPVAFRPTLSKLIRYYERTGGLTRFVLDFRAKALPKEAESLLATALKKICATIINGPVTYAGGSLESGRMFDYDSQRREVKMSAALWRELSLLGHWIQDAIVLRWAELTEEVSRRGVRTSEVIELLLTKPIPERDVYDARETYRSLPTKICTWTGKPIKDDFAVDHVIPYSLWHNNDLWNLVPVLARVNSKKSDKLPTRDLLQRRKDCLVSYWESLHGNHKFRFENEAGRLIGVSAFPKNWQNATFSSVAEAVEITALQRGCDRWQP